MSTQRAGEVDIVLRRVSSSLRRFFARYVGLPAVLLVRTFPKAVLVCLFMLTLEHMDGVMSPLCARDYPTELLEMSVQDLMDIEVSSVSRREQKLSDAAAAVFVITQEDIRRSGATSIPEVLRMVPGLEVAHIDANKWAISSRGFNGRFANKLLVLMDGRTVYTPLYSGVFWDVQDTMLEDIDRIEVIRGPGATLWGANAVNGVINIITKSAADTQGGLVVAGSGSEERGFGAVRYGGRIREDAFWRVYAKSFSRDGGADALGGDGADDWDAFRGGFRLDWRPTGGDSVTFQGDAYKEDAGQTLRLPLLRQPFLAFLDDNARIEGADLLAKWEHSTSSSSSIGVQLYYDRMKIEDILLTESRDTFDLDLQHCFRGFERHEFIWGLGYRLYHDSVENTFHTALDPASKDAHLFSVFLQDDISLIKEKLHLVLGTKIEHNDYTGFEIQPNARLIWTPHVRHTFWAAISRAVRTPSRTEEDGRLNIGVLAPFSPGNPSPNPGIVSVFGNRDFLSEELIAYELGYRVQPATELSFDLAVFYNDYDHLRTVVGAAANQPLSFRFTNSMKGEVYGVELAADWNPLKWWRLRAAYTFLEMRLHPASGLEGPAQEAPEGQNPHHQVSLRSLIDLPWHFELDTWLRWVDELSALGVGSYATLDARLGWKPAKNLELSIVGQNLLDSHHPEFALEVIDPTVRTEVQRAIYGKVTWRF